MIMNKNLLKSRILAILFLFSLLTAFFGAPQPAQAQAGSVAGILAEINGLRSANGMTPLAENIYLDIAAQNHANWIAETGQGGHTGEGGSSAQDRALAAGYGEGAQVWVTENWARGPGLTTSDCVYVMWNDPAHMDNMLTTWHNEFGAGVALDAQGFTVYVVNFGHTTGGAPLVPTTTPGGPTRTPAPIIMPVNTAVPNPDGSVIHIVEPGQTLWGIVEAYGISMVDLLAQNELTEDSILYPGQELLIFPAREQTPVVTEPPPTPEPTRTALPSSTPTERQVTPAQTPAPTEKPNRMGTFFTNIFSGDTLWVGIGLVAVSVFGIVLLFFTSARLK